MVKSGALTFVVTSGATAVGLPLVVALAPVLVTLLPTVGATLTWTLRLASVAPAPSDASVQVTVVLPTVVPAQLHVPPPPARKVRPAGSVSVTVITPDVWPVPVFFTEKI